MSEKFQQIVNAPHRAVGSFVKKIKDTKPKTIGGKIARGAGVATAGMTQFLLWLAKYITLDNHITRGGEKLFSRVKVGKNKDGKDKKFPKFIKQNPNFTAIVSWWMLLASVYGGYKVGQDLSSEDSEIKTRVESVLQELRHHDGEIEDFKLDPNASAEDWNQQIDAIHPYVVAHIFSSEGFIADSYDDNGGKGTATVGAGFTIEDDIHIKFAERVLARPVSSTDFHITKSEARLLADAWLREQVYPEMKKRFDKPLDYKLFTVLAVSAYNRGTNTFRDGNRGAPVRRAINDGKSQDKITQEFLRAFGGTRSTKWGGLANKYAVCALYYDGTVKDTTILHAIAEAPYTLDKPVKKYQQEHEMPSGYEKGRLLLYGQDGRVNGIITPENINEMLLETKYRKTKGTIQEPVMVYLTPEEVDVITRGRKFESSPRKEIVHLTADDVQNKQPVVKSDNYETLYENALALYKAENYTQAASEYEKLVADYPDNALLRNDLAATYNRLGRYNDAIKQAQEVVRRIGDKSRYAAAQYNAGYAYEQLGNLQKALANYKLSVANGNKKVNADVTRVRNMLNQKTNDKAKRTAFNDAAIRIQAKQNTKQITIQKIGASRA